MADPWAAFPVVGGGAATADPWAAFPEVGAAPSTAVETPKEPEKPTHKVSDDYGFTSYAMGSLPFGEEVQAAGGSLGTYLRKKLSGEPVTLSDAYNEKLAELRADHAAYAEGNPVKAVVGDVAGGAAFAPARLAKGATTVANAAFKALPQTALGGIAQGGRQAAAIGATYGVGGEGDIGERLWDGFVGGGIGGTIGLALPTTFEIGKAAIAGPASAIRGWKDPVGYGERKAIQALRRDGKAPDEMQDALVDAWVGGAPDVTLADVGGRNAKRRVRDAQNMPGRAAEEVNTFLNERQVDSGVRAMKKFDDYWGGPNRNPLDEMDILVKEREQKAGPYYKAAEAANPPVNTSKAIGEIDKVLSPGGSAPVAQAAGDLKDGTISGKLRYFRDRLATGTQTRVGLNQLHEVKMDLDGAIDDAMHPVTGHDTTLSRRLKAVRGELIDAMDAASDDYRKGRKIWAGESRQMSAIGTGEKLFSLSEEELERRLRKMNTAELAGFRVGAHRAIRAVVDKKDSTSVYERLFGGRELRTKMRMAIGDGVDFDDFTRFIEAEKEQFATRATAQGNSTSVQQALGAMDGGMDATVQVTKEVIQQGALSASLNAIGRVASKLGGWTEDSAAETARILLSTDPAVQTRILQELAKQVKAGAIPAPFYQRVLTVTGAQQGGKATNSNSSPMPSPPPLPGSSLIAPRAQRPDNNAFASIAARG